MRFPLFFFLLASCSSTHSPVPILGISVDEQDDGVVPDPVDGRGLYLQNCASCHNDNGDGEGVLAKQLGVRARSFAQGGFAFGNTREAVFRTITAGMPGSSAMPSFKTKLDDAQRWKIAEFVVSLTPSAGSPEKAEGSVIRVTDRPVIARGKLPSLGEGLPERPRGLLIGLPEGLTFEYRIDDARFLGVRLGEFADRMDWNDRGGACLQPLGAAFYRFFEGDPPAALRVDASGASTPLQSQMRASWVRGAQAGIEYEMLDAEGATRVLVRESVSTAPLSVGSPFTRRIAFANRGKTARLLVPAAGSDKGQAWARSGEWWVGEAPGKTPECVLFSLPAGAAPLVQGDRIYAQIDLAPSAECAIEATTVLSADSSSPRLQALAAEIRR